MTYTEAGCLWLLRMELSIDFYTILLLLKQTTVPECVLLTQTLTR